MKKLIFSFVWIFLVSYFPLKAQILDRLKDKAGRKAKEVANNAVQNQRSKYLEKLRKQRAEMDSSNYTCAIAVSDNTAFYEEDQKTRKALNSFGQDFLTDGRINLNASDRIADATDPYEKALSQMEWGEMMMSWNKFKSAESSFLKAEKNFIESGKTENIYYAKLLSNLGLLYSNFSAYEASQQYLQEALNLRKKIIGEQSVDVAISINNLAVLESHKGNYTKVQELIQQAILMAELKSADKSILGIMYNNKAYFQQMIGQNQKALEVYEIALQVLGDEKGQKSLAYQRVAINKAIALQEIGKLDDAIALIEKAMKIRRNQFGASSPDYAHMLNLAASIYMQKQDYKKVESYLQDAYNIYKKKLGEQHPSTAKVMNNLGLYYLSQNDLKKAEENIKKSYEIRKNTLGENHPDFNASQENLALVYWYQGKINEASDLFRKSLHQINQFIASYFPALSETEKEQYWAKFKPTYMRFYNFAMQNGEKHPELLSEMYNAHITTKGILLNATNKIKQRILSSGNQELIKEYNQWISFKEQLAYFYTLSKEELKEQEIDLVKFERETNDLERKLSQKSEIFKQKVDDKLHTIKEIDHALAPNEAALEIIAFQEFDKKFTGNYIYVALMAGKHQHNHPKFALLGKGKEFEEDELNFYKNMVRFRKDDKNSYNTYWAKIEKLLEGKKRIFVSLDGIYNQISLNSIKKPDGKFVIDDFNLTFVTNTRFVPDIKEREKKAKNKPNKKALLVGYPNYGDKGTIPSLPGTKKEVEAISPILKAMGYRVDVLLDNQATESNVKKADDATHPDILHIATHGYFINEVDEGSNLVFGIEPTKALNNPMLRSGLMFAGAEATMEGIKNDKETSNKDNGLLTAYEMANMNLDNSELAILSACETGLGDVKAGEGVYGLQRALQIAGVDAAIISLWKVSDDATQELMKIFYNELKTAKNKPDAFRKAQIKLKEKYKEPYYWAAFVMTEN